MYIAQTNSAVGWYAGYHSFEHQHFKFLTESYYAIYKFKQF